MTKTSKIGIRLKTNLMRMSMCKKLRSKIKTSLRQWKTLANGSWVDSMNTVDRSCLSLCRMKRVSFRATTRLMFKIFKLIPCMWDNPLTIQVCKAFQPTSSQETTLTFWWRTKSWRKWWQKHPVLRQLDRWMNAQRTIWRQLLPWDSILSKESIRNCWGILYSSLVASSPWLEGIYKQLQSGQEAFQFHREPPSSMDRFAWSQRKTLKGMCYCPE